MMRTRPDRATITGPVDTAGGGPPGPRTDHYSDAQGFNPNVENIPAQAVIANSMTRHVQSYYDEEGPAHLPLAAEAANQQIEA